jgi:hypothetical protein
MKNGKVYKMLRGKQSAFDHGKYTLEYIPNKWTYPSAGKIYAFQNYHQAMRWASEYPGDSLWEAEAEIFKDGNCMMCTNEDCSLCDFWEWYSFSLKGEAKALPPCLSVAYTPNGTVLCNKLRITRKIEDL